MLTWILLTFVIAPLVVLGPVMVIFGLIEASLGVTALGLLLTACGWGPLLRMSERGR